MLELTKSTYVQYNFILIFIWNNETIMKMVIIQL